MVLYRKKINYHFDKLYLLYTQHHLRRISKKSQK